MSPTPPARRRLSPRKRPAQERSRETLRAILEAAAQLFEAHGLAGATTDHIAERAGVSIGSLYQYFPSKEAIVASLAQCHVLETGEALAPVLARCGGERPLDAVLAELVHAVVALHADRPRLHQVLAHEAPVDSGHAQARADAVHALAARLGEVLRGHAEVRVRDPALAAHLVLETLLGLAHRFAIEPAEPGEPADPAARLAAREAEIVRMLLSYLLAQPRAYRIERASAGDDLAELQQIEREAAALFAERDVPPAQRSDVTSLDELRHGQAAGLLWIARDAGRAIGFALVDFVDGLPHLEEIDVAWNAPFYARLGFRILEPAELTPGLAELLRDEAARGLDPARRVAMRRALGR